MGEHLLCKQGVGGSNPLASTRGKTLEERGWSKQDGGARGRIFHV